MNAEHWIHNYYYVQIVWLSRLQHAQDKYREAVKKSEQVVGLEDCLRNLSTARNDEPPWPPTRAMCEHQFTRRSAVRPPVTPSSGGGSSQSSRGSMSPADDRDVASRSSNGSRRIQTNGGGGEEEVSQRSVGSSASRGLRKIASGLMEFYRSPPSSSSLVCFKQRRRRRSRSCSYLSLLQDAVPSAASPPRVKKCHSLQDIHGLDSGLAMRLD